MGVFTSIITRISQAMHWVAGITIWVIIAVTWVDVILRHFGHPIVGSFEIISFLGAIVVGLALPYTSLMKGHIYVDFLVNKFSKDRRRRAACNYTNFWYVSIFCAGLVLFFHGMGSLYKRRSEYNL